MKFRLMILLVFLSISCQDIEQVERPENLIPESKMVEILTDVSLLTSAKNYNRRKLEETGFKPEEYLYQKHNIDSLRLAKSTKFYAQEPANLERIYTKVQKNLESLKADLDEIREEELRVLDSINAVIREGDSLRINKDLINSEDSLVPSPEVMSDTLMPVPQMARRRRQ